MSDLEPLDLAPAEGDVVTFDYLQLEPDVRADALAAVGVIRLYGRQTVECIVGIGKELIKVKKRLPRGAFLPWLKAEFGWDETRAKRFMRVYRWAKRKSVNLADLEPIDLAPRASIAGSMANS